MTFTALPIDRSWSLFAALRDAVLDAPRIRQQGRSFFEAEIEVVQSISHPGGRLPEHAALELDVRPSRGDRITRVRLLTLPLEEAPEAREAADAGVAAIGGAGFDALMAKATRLWQVDAELVSGPDARAPLVVAGVLASVLLAPIVPPGGGTIFGVKGARVRLESLRWPES